MTDVVKYAEAGVEYPEPTFPARYDFESWCWHQRHATGETGDVARFVLSDTAAGCWPNTRSLEPFHHSYHGRGAVGRENIFTEHLLVDHGAGLDAPLVRLVAEAHQQYLADLCLFWKQAEKIPGPAPALDTVLDFGR